MRICLVTAEFHGLFKNGGIGTANTGLALELAEAGHDVTVAYIDHSAWSGTPPGETFVAVRAHWREHGVFLDIVPRWSRLKAGVEDFGWSLSVLHYLRAATFDVVLFNECGGQGYFSVLAKRAGVFPNAPRMIVVTHGASEWARDLNGQLPPHYRAGALAFLERRSVELADHVVSPSHYLVGWMREHAWRLPEHTEVLQNIVPVATSPGETAPEGVDEIDEIVFFGRLEARKGLEIFCDAVEALDRAGRLGKVGITFLGKFSRVEGVHSGVYLIERSKGWSFAPRLCVNLGQEEALTYLKRRGVLAVMPSLAENSPCVVVECLLAGVPFVASEGGGARELITEADRAACLVAPEGAALAAKIEHALARGAARARLAEPQAQTKSRWRALMETRDPLPPPNLAAAPRVSVCISLPFGAEIEPATMEALRAQTYRDVQVVVVAYGAEADSRTAPSDDEIRLTRRSPDRAAARNAAAAEARGDWLVFLRERGVLWEPQALATLIEAAQRLDAQAVSGFAYEHSRPGRPKPEWDGEMASAPIGPCLPIAAIENCVGDDIFVISRRAFEALDGYESGVHAFIEDRVLLTRMLARGMTLELAPEILAWRRVGAAGQGEDIADARRVLKIFAQTPLGAFSAMVESVLTLGNGKERATARLAGLDTLARDLALTLTLEHAAGGPESAPIFVRYCLARHRFVEALDFARLHNQAALVPLVEAGLSRETGRSLRRGPRAMAKAVNFTLSLRPDLVARLRLQTAPDGAVMGRDAYCVASLRLPKGTTIAKAPLGCPPGTLRLTAAVHGVGAGVGSTEVALAVADPMARVVLTETGPEPDVLWTGWRPAAEAQLVLDLEATTAPRDIFLLGRNSTSDEVWAVWREVSARGSLSDFATPSALTPAETAHKLTMRVLQRGEVMTDASDFPYTIWIPGERTLHHPLAGRACVVRIPQAIPAGCVGVTASFAAENAQAHPIAFALWVSPTSPETGADPATADSSTGSGWTLCAEPFEAESSQLRFERPTTEPLDLYLATKVVGFDDVGWCHAIWREIAVIEAATAD